MMRDKRQAHLLIQYIEQLKQDPSVLPPQGLNKDMAVFAQQLFKSQDNRNSRMWGNILSQVNQEDVGHQAIPVSVDKKETQQMLAKSILQSRSMPSQPTKMSIPITLIAAMLMLALGVTVMFALNNLPQGLQGANFASQIDSGQPQSSSAQPIGTSGIVISDVIGAGDLRQEGIVIQNLNNTRNLDGWTLSDENDNLYTFSEDRRLFSNASLTVYTRDGSDGAQMLYWGLESALFSDSANTITLTDSDGMVQSVYTQGSYIPTSTPIGGIPPMCIVTAPADAVDGVTLFHEIHMGEQDIRLMPGEEGRVIRLAVSDTDDERGYYVELTRDGVNIYGWVSENDVEIIGEPCPDVALSNNAGAVGVTLMPTALPPMGAPSAIDSLMAQYDYVPMVIATSDLPVGTPLNENVLTVIYVPVEEYDIMLVSDIDEALGLRNLNELSRWEPIRQDNLFDGE